MTESDTSRPNAPEQPAYRTGGGGARPATLVVDQIGSVPRRRWGVIEAGLLSAALFALAACCVLTSAKKYYWCDEVFSWLVVTDPSLHHMLAALYNGADGAPPVFYLAARAWTDLFGRSELAFRSLSCAGFMVALAVVWFTLRRAYGRWPAAIGALTAFSMSLLVEYHVAEARFYGFLTAFVACAVYLYARACWGDGRSRWLFVATALTHTALVYTHVYGLFYSVAILAAWIVADRLAGRPWHRGYLAIVVAWVTFIPWLPAVRRVSAIGVPHSWIPVPGATNLIEMYGFRVQYLAVILAAVLVLGAVGVYERPAHRAGGGAGAAPHRYSRAWRIVLAGIVLAVPAHDMWLHRGGEMWPGNASYRAIGILVVATLGLVAALAIRQHNWPSRSMARGPATLALQDPLLIVGFALLAVPLAAFAISRVGTSIFWDRYFIPAGVGLGLVLAHVTFWSIGGFDDARRETGPWSIARRLTIASWALLLAWLALWPVRVAQVQTPEERPGSVVERVVPKGTTVVVESAINILPLRHYQRRDDITYVYPADWAAATDGRAALVVTVEYNLLKISQRVGYLDSIAMSGARVPCEGRPFAVALSGGHYWFVDRVAADSGFFVQPLPGFRSTFERDSLVMVRPPAVLGNRTCPFS